MARLPLDFSKINDTSFPVFSPGKYTLLIKEVRQEAAKSSGELKLSVQFEIQDGPNGGTENAGKKLFSSYSLQAKAAFRVRKLCVACGMSKEEIDAGVDDELMVGRSITADLAVEKYNGRDLNRVQNEAPVGGTFTSTTTPGTFAAPPTTGFKAPTNFEGIPAGWGAPADGVAPPAPKTVE